MVQWGDSDDAGRGVIAGGLCLSKSVEGLFLVGGGWTVHLQEQIGRQSTWAENHFPVKEGSHPSVQNVGRDLRVCFIQAFCFWYHL